MYDPQVGRFLQRDPFGGLLGEPQSQQPYAYAHNNPVNLTDPSGEYVETALDVAFIGYDLYALATGGQEQLGTNLLALGADVVGAVLPGATGLGQAVRGVRAVTNASKSGRVAFDGARQTQHFVSDLSHATGKTASSRNRALRAIITEDFSHLRITGSVQYSPFIRTGVALEGVGMQIGKNRFSSRQALRTVIVHEELHQRWWARGIPSSAHHSDRFYDVIARYTRMRGW